MKKRIMVLTLLFLLTGCRAVEPQPQTPPAPTTVIGEEQTVDLMPDASPETSALALYFYDGQTVRRSFLFDSRAEEVILKDFHNAKVLPVALNTTELKPPYYALEIGGKDGFSVCGLWSDGYFLTDDGAAYAFGYDFPALRQAYVWENEDTFTDSAVLPCAYHAARTENGWNTGFLTAAQKPEGQKGISMKLVSVSAEQAVVRYVNQRFEAWSYGLSTELHVLSNGEWYRLPTQKDYGVSSIAMLVSAGQSREQDYSLAPYGQLPAGTYRLVSNGLSVEFVSP